eukprot:Skav201039  [mRNA]  locus=scaffold3386:228678:230729:+ [translate_table: standard]
MEEDMDAPVASPALPAVPTDLPEEEEGHEPEQEEGQVVDEPPEPTEAASTVEEEAFEPLQFSHQEKEQYERALFQNVVVDVGRHLPKLPWETGIFSQIFGQDDSLGFPKLEDAVPRPVGIYPENKEQELSTDRMMLATGSGLPMIPVYAKCIKSLCDRDYLEAMDVTWTRGLACWLTIIESSQFKSQVGCYVLEKLHYQDREGALVAIRDACGVRSPNTVLKRARDLQQFISWMGDNFKRWWPLTEKDLLEYVAWAELNTKSKFIGKNLVHAVKFFRFVMGADFKIEEVVGPLLSGRVSRVLATRDPTHQARPLTVDELKRLEWMVIKWDNPVEAYYVGCLLFALYSRARWSDMAHMQFFFFDVIETSEGPFGFVEAKTRLHKTSTTAERKAMYMPYVAPVFGVAKEAWGLGWQRALLALGLLPGNIPYGPICKAMRPDGSFTRRPLTSDEGTGLLCGYLEQVKGAPDSPTTHSLKATTLVWAARYGLGDNTRTILGHHSIQGASLACYSRDLMAEPLRELCAMLLNIRHECFLPDSTRSGWFQKRIMKLTVDELPVDPARGGTPDFEAEAEKDMDADEAIEIPSVDIGGDKPERPSMGALPEIVEEEGAGDEGIASASSDDGSSSDSADEEEFHQKESSMVESGITLKGQSLSVSCLRRRSDACEGSRLKELELRVERPRRT